MDPNIGDALKRWWAPGAAAAAIIVALSSLVYTWGLVRRGSTPQYPLPTITWSSTLTQELMAFSSEDVLAARDSLETPTRNLFEPVDEDVAVDPQSFDMLPGPAPPPEWIFKGRVTLGARSVAVLENRTSGETWFVGVGESVGSLELLDMNDETVVISMGSGEQMTLEIVP